MARPVRVLITGGSGFIGANLAQAEIEAGNEVHLLLRAEARMWRLNQLRGRFVAHRADLCDPRDVRRAVDASRPEVIYHLGVHGAYPSQTDRGRIVATNLSGTLNLLEALSGHEYRALVHTGSSSEYGHKDGPMSEADVPEPRTDYAITKTAATLFCQARAFEGAPITTVRVFSAYGPWEEPSRLVPYVLDSCLRGIPPRVSAGAQPRDFIHVDDVVGLLRAAAENPACHGHILHAGTGIETPVRQMVQVIGEVCGGPAPIFGAEPNRAGEPGHWRACMAGTFARTTWRPQHDLVSGIRQMKAWWHDCQARRAA